MADDYFALQPSGVHNDDSLPNGVLDESPSAPGQGTASGIEDQEGYLSPFDSPEQPGTKSVLTPIKEGARTKPVLSPSELVSVLDRDSDPPPKPDAR